MKRKFIILRGNMMKNKGYTGIDYFRVLYELWVYKEKAGMKISAFSLVLYFSYLGIWCIIKISREERR